MFGFDGTQLKSDCQKLIRLSVPICPSRLIEQKSNIINIHPTNWQKSHFSAVVTHVVKQFRSTIWVLSVFFFGPSLVRMMSMIIYMHVYFDFEV